MNLLLGTASMPAWIYATMITSLLELQLSSAGDACPPQEKLNPCLCFQESVNRDAHPTTPMPIENTLPRNVIEGSSNNLELKDGIKLRNIELAALTAKSSHPANATCCTLITCNAPKSLFILEDAITNALSRKWIDKLTVTNLPPQKDYTLVRLPSGFLKTLRVKHFEVRDTLLSGDFIHYGTPFEGQEQSMLWFTASNCYMGGSLTYDTVGTVNSKGLNSMPKIEGVDFSRNHIVLIAATGFRYPPTNLSTIILSHNSIQGIETGTFNHIPLLKRLDLSHNLLEIIARNMFASPSRNLQHIDLSWNQLKVLPVDFFVNMPQLKVVILSNNFLTSMATQPWSTVWRQLQFVDLTNNFVLCDCSLMWLVSILSPPATKAPTASAPVPLAGQIVLGSCSYVQPNVISKIYKLESIARESLNC